MNEDIIGGVSPLKKKLVISGGKSHKGGTKTKSKGTKGKKSGGWGQSTGKHNTRANTKNTRYRIPTEKKFPGAGGGNNTTNPNPAAPYMSGPPGVNIDFKDMFGDFINNNNLANVLQNGGGSETEDEIIEEITPGWTEDVETEIPRDSEGGLRNACNEKRRTSKYFKNGKNAKGETFEEECDGYNNSDNKGKSTPEIKVTEINHPETKSTKKKTTTKKKNGNNTAKIDFTNKN